MWECFHMMFTVVRNCRIVFDLYLSSVNKEHCPFFHSKFSFCHSSLFQNHVNKKTISVLKNPWRCFPDDIWIKTVSSWFPLYLRVHFYLIMYNLANSGILLQTSNPAPNQSDIEKVPIWKLACWTTRVSWGHCPTGPCSFGYDDT